MVFCYLFYDEINIVKKQKLSLKFILNFHGLFEKLVKNEVGLSTSLFSLIGYIWFSLTRHFKDFWILNWCTRKMCVKEFGLSFLNLPISFQKVLVSVIALQTHFQGVIHPCWMSTRCWQRNSSKWQITEVTHAFSIVFTWCMWTPVDDIVLFCPHFLRYCVEFLFTDLLFEVQVLLQISLIRW